MEPEPLGTADFPHLGDLLDGWIERHCVVPDGYLRGKPFQSSDWQFWVLANHYRIRDGVTYKGRPLLNQAFHYRRSLVVGPQKALALDTPVATPDGWSTIADLAAGDVVFDMFGKPTTVLGKSDVFVEATYRVTFSDGAQLVAGADHEWVVDRRSHSSSYLPARVSTQQMVDDGLVDGGGARRYRVPVAGPLQIPCDWPLPVDPYTLGAWLGDGNSDDGRITGLDDEVFDRIAAAGYEIRRMVVRKRRSAIGLAGQLRTLGVLNNKHIPARYLRATEDDRWALLQGLMDTDGYADVRQGKCEFTTTLPALRDGVSELLHTLGIRHKVYAGEATLYGRVTGPKWRVSFSARSDMPVFHLSRKQERLKPPGRSHSQFKHRRMVAIDPVEPVPTQCITVDADSHTFLAGREMIPTGNSGKGPAAATIVAAEAVGPTQFAGWARDGDVYRCSDQGCDCGWTFAYRAGEPMGGRHPSPLIQLTATSEDQVDNVYRPLQAMIKLGPLSELMKVREGFIRILGSADDPDLDRIDVVTASANSRLGNPISFALQDETGLYTATNKMRRVAETQRRGAAGMGGRTMETTNAWDPAEQSVAQTSFESTADDVWKYYRAPPAGLSYRNKRERRKIHAHVYAGSPWVDLASIEAEAAEILLSDPAQAERFFGNRIVATSDAYFDAEAWNACAAPTDIPAGAVVCLGFDGSMVDDWTAIRGRVVTDDGPMYGFTPTFADGVQTIWNPADYGGEVPRGEVQAAVDELFARYDVARFYLDPELWQSEIDAWATKYGDKRVITWATYRTRQMAAALERLRTDVATGSLTHDDCLITASHVANARRVRRSGGIVVGKPNEHQKIDAVMADALAHEAACDVRAEGIPKKRSRRMVVYR